MINVYIEEIINSHAVFNLLCNKKGIDIKTSYLIGKAHRKIKKEVQLYEEIRNKKIIEYGELNENGVPQVPQAKFIEHMEELQKILKSVEIEIHINRININVFSKIDMEPIIFSELHWLFTDEDADPVPV